jgi:23S rRNA (guanosine2251-2'-O)-methyltransferase
MKSLRPGNYGKETTFSVRNFDAPLSPEEYAQQPKHPIHLVLDNLRSAFNVGSIFRTADTARLARVITCGYTAHPPHPKLDKTALGTLSYVATEHVDITRDAVVALRQEGIPVWGLETTSHSRLYTKVAYPQPLALVLGNEALGISLPVLEHCDQLIEIPMFGYKNSLNVAAAAAVVVFEVLRQWDLTTKEYRPAPQE